ncbi:MAG: hypothetical protein OEZ68_08265 [Gammaproteobacteria bacterium]|nr:hypothetical protein [Gammaproteobacteria bacterium]MDH5800782.1 hypothetical protein [Gammaproteobacteria bacterium]
MAIPGIQTGLNGIHNGLDNLKRDAHEIATASAKGNEDPGDLARSLVDLNTDRTQVQAAVKVVQAVDESLGTLLDVLA